MRARRALGVAALLASTWACADERPGGGRGPAPAVRRDGGGSAAEAGAEADASADDGAVGAEVDAAADAAIAAFDARSTLHDAAPDAGAGGAPDAWAPDASAPDASAPDAAAPDASAPDAGGPNHVHIDVSNTCVMTVTPPELSFPRASRPRFAWHNHSVDYPVDVWMSYGGGFLDLAPGATWMEPVDHCLGPNAHDEYADISAGGCASFRFLIHCL